jgi:3-isopropylmalate/(R)-2-methylmalate dehydratase small subunit
LNAIDAFTTVSGVAAPLPQANTDTDVIMPKQFLKGITRDDLARGLFYDLRFDAAGKERAEFILNQAAYRKPSFLIVGPNFGCGSSREHAVWGLRQFGIRAVIGTSFASIFQDNCFRNGVLPITLPPGSIESMQKICSEPQRNRLCVDLTQQTISLRGSPQIGFSIDALRRDDLLSGRDAVASTLQFATDIHAFELRHWISQPWLKPPTVGT